MSDEQSSRKIRFQLDMAPEEQKLLDDLTERVKARTTSRAGRHAKVTRRSVVIEALEALGRELDVKETERERSAERRKR